MSYGVGGTKLGETGDYCPLALANKEDLQLGMWAEFRMLRKSPVVQKGDWGTSATLGTTQGSQRLESRGVKWEREVKTL